MKCIILAAGYATRMYPLTENFPKPLLELGGKPILDWLIDDVDRTGLIDSYYVVTNHKFATHFETWAERRNGWLADGSVVSATVPPSASREGGAQALLGRGRAQRDVEETTLPSERILIIDDGTSTNETRLGAVKDIQFTVEQARIDDDILVMAGDNLLEFELADFVKFSAGLDKSCVMRYYEADPVRLRKSGVASIDEAGRIVSMVEKPAEPQSNWCIPPFYFYKREDIARLPEAITDGCGTDAPGSLVAWLSAHSEVYTWEMPAARIDIGSLASYEAARRRFDKETDKQ